MASKPISVRFDARIPEEKEILDDYNSAIRKQSFLREIMIAGYQALHKAKKKPPLLADEAINKAAESNLSSTGKVADKSDDSKPNKSVNLSALGGEQL